MTAKYPQPPQPHLLAAVDLGKRKCGLALFFVNDQGHARLLAAETTRQEDGDPEAMAQALVDAIPALPVLVPVFWVVEWPQKYEHLRARHENLEELHAVGYALKRRVPVVAEYRPAEWKGNVPKAAHHKRLQRELAPMDATLPPPGDDTHDMWDAVGIGLYATGRTRRGGTRA